MLEKIKKIIKQIILPSNKSLYYGRYQGSVSNWRLLLWNLRHPGRLYNRFRYGQLFKINSMRKSSFKKIVLVLVQLPNFPRSGSVLVPT